MSMKRNTSVISDATNSSMRNTTNASPDTSSAEETITKESMAQRNNTDIKNGTNSEYLSRRRL